MIRFKILFMSLFIFASFCVFPQKNDNKIKDVTADLKIIDATGDTAKTDATSDRYNWLKQYITLDPSNDIYYGYVIKKYKISKEYIEALQWNQRIEFFIDDFDKYNFRKNTNILPWFPFVFTPYSGYNFNRGFGLGFLFRADNIANSRIDFSAATSFEQKGKFWQDFNIEYPGLLKSNRLRLFWTFAVSTTYPQFASSLSYYDSSNAIINIFNKVWRKLGFYFTDFNETGLYFVSGFDYRIPKIEVNTITSFEFNYKNYSGILDHWDDIYPAMRNVSHSDFSFNIKEELRWSKMKPTTTIPVGNELTGSVKFYLPTNVGPLNSEFRFKSKIEDRFTKKIFREFAVRARAILFGNYNISDDYSGDPYIRGFLTGELTGFCGLLANLELYIPLVNIDIKTAGNLVLNRDAKFLLYLVLFADGGFTIDNYDYITETYPISERHKVWTQEKQDENHLRQFWLVDNYYITPAISAGGGLRLYPYFLNFIVKFDVAVNILKAAYEKDGLVEITLSFTETF
jgi:hypothetical protein